MSLNFRSSMTWSDDIPEKAFIAVNHTLVRPSNYILKKRKIIFHIQKIFKTFLFQFFNPCCGNTEFHIRKGQEQPVYIKRPWHNTIILQKNSITRDNHICDNWRSDNNNMRIFLSAIMQYVDANHKRTDSVSSNVNNTNVLLNLIQCFLFKSRWNCERKTQQMLATFHSSYDLYSNTSILLLHNRKRRAICLPTLATFVISNATWSVLNNKTCFYFRLRLKQFSLKCILLIVQVTLKT